MYAEIAPAMLRYDLRQRCYVFAGGTPYFSHDVEQALFSLSGDRAIALNSQHAKRLESWVDCSIKRKVPLPLVATITRCMYQRLKMKATYVSLSSGEQERVFSPLALVNDGLRWHVRCFDHRHKEYRDYSMTRFTSASESEPSDVGIENDEEWNTEVEVRLAPHPESEHPEAIRLDYDIHEELKRVTLRACLVGYFLRHWNVDFTETGSGNPRAQQLFLQNRSELLQRGVPKWALEG